MVFIKNWEEFSKNVLICKRKFYVYGAGLVYKKLAVLIKDDVICVLDQKFRELSKCKWENEIAPPNSICNDIEDTIHILCCLNPFKDYMKRFLEVEEFFQLLWKKIFFYTVLIMRKYVKLV